MTPLVYLLYALQVLGGNVDNIRKAPAGTQLHVRLKTTVGSYASKVGQPVTGVLIAPIVLDGQLILPAGSLVTGKITKVTRVGYGVYHELASLGLEFNRVVLPGGETIPLDARIAQVDNARERVNSRGLIQGVRATGSISYRVSGYVRTAVLWAVHAEMAEWAVKSLLVALPEPEIYYPAGSELTLRLTAPLAFLAPAEAAPLREQLAGSDLDELRDLVASMPVRTIDPETHKPSDLTNVLLVGSRQEIETAFSAAGWSEAGPDSVKARIGCIRAAAEIHGFTSAPMTPLLLEGAGADMSWQKSLNDVAKRHHIRIWKQPGQWNGQDLWMAAATRDVDFAYLRPGRTFTHRIDPHVDEERDKVSDDLAFTSCAHPLVWTERQSAPRLAYNATGDPIATDTRLVVLQMNGCAAGPTTDAPETESLVARGGKWKRFARREIIITRSDFIRDNIYWRSYEMSRWAVQYVRYRRKKASELRSLQTEYGPGGASTPAFTRTSGHPMQSLR